jgi:hypothetical protein
MKINKKASNETLSLLVSILITILILTPIIVIAYRAFAEKGATEKCYNDIIKAAKELGDEKNTTVLCQLEMTSGIVAFEAGVSSLVLTGVPVTISDISLKGLGEQITGEGGIISSKDIILNKPSQCIDNNLACICYCALNLQGIQSDRYTNCKSAPKCTQLPSIKEIKGVYTPFSKISYNNHYGGMFIFAKKGLLGIYLSKYRERIYICESGKEGCEINQLDKKSLETDKETALKSKFNELQSNCLNTKDCYCGDILSDIEVKNFEILKEKSGKSYVIANTKDLKLKIYESSSDLCVYKNKKETVVSKPDEKVDLANLRILKLNNKMCFTDELDVVTKACFEKPLIYTDLKQSCLNNKEEKCYCNEKLKIEKIENSDYKITEYSIQFIDNNIGLLGTTDKGSQESLIDNLGKEVCFYDGKEIKDVQAFFDSKDNSVKLNPFFKPFKSNVLKLVKVGDNVCFSNVTSYTNCVSEVQTPVVSLR